MGVVQKIFYFHVPSAMMTFLAAFVCGIASAIYLWNRSKFADHIAVSAAELAVLFGLIVLVTGPLWARKAWGVWWQWDVRLTMTLVMWMIFVRICCCAGLAARALRFSPRPWACSARRSCRSSTSR
jgi:heme exporter protein C